MPFLLYRQKRLEHVAAEAGIELDIHWHSFELDPDAPAKHDTSNTERLAKKYGSTYEEMEEMERNIAVWLLLKVLTSNGKSQLRQ